MGCARNLAKSELHWSLQALALAQHSPVIAGMAHHLLGSAIGEFSRQIGAATEEVAAELLSQLFGSPATRSDRLHGVDILQTYKGVPAAIEVKTVPEHGMFGSRLENTTTGRQMSDSWLQADLWLQERGIDPASCVPLGVEIVIGESDTTAAILLRGDSDARYWEPVIAPFSIAGLLDTEGR